MPVSWDLLTEDINRCILVNAEHPVYRALRKLVQAGGEGWWHLVVDLGDGRFAAVQFNKLSPLVRSQGRHFFDQPLDSLVASIIPLVRVVERSAIGTEAAKDLADESPGRVLVVTQDGGFVGIIYRGEAGADSTETPLLTILLEYGDDFRPYTASMAPPPAPPPPAPPPEQARYIQAQVAEPAAGAAHLPAGAPLLAECQYKLDVHIGPPDLEWLGPPPEAVFPDHELPPTQTFNQLQVVFFEPFHAPDPQLQTIQLPSRGSSSTASFNFTTLPDRADFEARIGMLYQNRILQTALLRSRVLTPERPVVLEGEAGLHMVIEALVRDRLSGLENDPGFGASIVLNQTPAGEHGLQAFSGDQALSVSLGGVQPLITAIKSELSAIYRSPEKFADGLWGNASQELLFRLAVSGSLLFKSLLQNQALANHPLFQQDRLQVVTTNVASFLPLEYIYDRQAPRLGPPHARLCPREKAEPCLQSGICHCDLVDERDVVCPLGFWGMRKVIERFAFERPPEAGSLSGEVFKVFAGINGGRTELKPFQRVIFAASDKVDEDQDHPHQIQSVLDTLQLVSGNHAQQVNDWAAWQQGVTQNRPTLLVMLPHHTIHPDLPIVHGLEISADQRRWVTELENQDVQAQGSAERPLVFLLGCETMSTDIPYESFVAAFLGLGAAIVLGTTTSVLGYHVAPVACKIAALMQSIIASGGSSFADVMLRLRRQGLLEGYPMVLTLFAYGDAGWVLTPA
jgi:hypothetical protein